MVWGDRVEDGQEALEADRVNETTKDDMAGCPAGITLLVFLDGSGLLSVRRIRSFERSESFVQGVEEHTTKALASLARVARAPILSRDSHPLNVGLSERLPA